MARVNSAIAYDYIRARIIKGEYPSGYALKTYRLSAEIGVSRTPIRDALHRLEVDGFVDIRPHDGAQVKSLSLKEFSELCAMRLALEGYLAGTAARIRTDMELREIGLALDTMRQLTREILEAKEEAALQPKLVREDVRFHLAIINAAKNEHIKKEVLRLHLIDRIVSGAKAATSNAEHEIQDRAARDSHRRTVLASHEQIYQAILQGDSTAARDSMERHLQQVIDINLRRLVQTNSESRATTLPEEEVIYSS
jgi:DNA-binding GntR family transcriptional regulator